MAEPTLAAWLLTQIEVDQAFAREAVRALSGRKGDPACRWAAHSGQCETEVLVELRPGQPLPPRVMEGRWGSVLCWNDYDLDAEQAEPLAEHIATWDPARVLAECAAKRRIIERHSPYDHPLGPFCRGCSDVPWDPELTFLASKCPELLDLASVYVDRPGYAEAIAS